MEMDLFEPGPMEGKLITGEVCVHFLHFSADDYPRLGNRIKCNPAIKTAADREGIVQALKDGRLDIIATDHAPHTSEEKASTDYLKAPSGLPLVQDALLCVLELYHKGVLSLEEVVLRTAHNPAIRYKVQERGFLREGYWADLVLVDLENATEVSDERALSKCGWTPFAGETFQSRILATLVNGQPVYRNGEIIEAGVAQRLQFGVQRDL
jgi:dihydroorotase